MSELIHVINEDGEYNSELDSIFKGWDLYDAGLDYKMCAILGVQSSGKSTLLNLLFGTHFQVLNESEEGRHQVTKGIWLGHCPQNNVLVFDVEGTDGRERGEEGKAFERKTSLFSMALAEIVIVNMWHHDIGRYEGANYNLFKIVFELNLQLFQRNKEGKTLLLFAIRDSKKVTLDKLRKAVLEDMTVIWKDIHKPSGFESSVVTDFFDFIFVPMPHFEFQHDEFLGAVKDLKDRFCNPNHGEYLWKDYKSSIPADGLAHFGQGIWDVIQSNQDLDLPGQRKLLAEWRCGQLAREAYDEFEVALKPVGQALRKGQLHDGFGAWGTGLVTKAMNYYNEPASRYSQEEAQREGAALLKRLVKDLESLFRDQLALLRSKCLADFDRNLKESLPKGDEAIEDFAGTVGVIQREAIERFTSVAKESLVEQAEDWDYHNDLQELEELLEKQVAREREEQMKRMLNNMKKRLKLQLVEPAQDAMDDASPEMWTRLRRLRETGRTQAQEYLLDRLRGFSCPEEETQERLRETLDLVDSSLISTLQTYVKSLYDHMVKKFEKKFKYDDKGLPRRWKPEDNLEDFYTKAFDEVSKMIDLFSVNRLVEDHADYSHFSDDEERANVPPEIIIMSRRECKEVSEHFKTTADALLTQARDDQDRINSRVHIPAFMIVLFLLFAFDEIMWVVSNPFLLPLFFVFGGGLAALWYLDMLYLVRPIATTMFNQVTAQFHAVTKSILEKMHKDEKEKEE